MNISHWIHQNIQNFNNFLDILISLGYSFIQGLYKNANLNKGEKNVQTY